MGTWNTGLFGNDTASDVRDTYLECLKQQFGDEDAYRRTYDEYQELMGTDEEPLFWYALALTQWKVGRLTDDVKDISLKWIERKGGLSLYEESKKVSSRWLITLEKLKENLKAVMPPRKKFRKPVEFVRNPWNVGDIYAYQFHTEYSKELGLLDKYILLQKIGDIEVDKNKINSIVQVYDRVYETIPSMEEVVKARILPLALPPGVEWMPKRKEDYVPSFDSCLRTVLKYEKKGDYPKNHLYYIGNTTCTHIDYQWNQVSDFYWDKDGMDEWLCEYYMQWQNVEY